MRGLFRGALLAGSAALLSYAAFSDSLPPDASYRPLPAQPFSVVRAADEAEKPTVMQRQADLLRSRYDLSDQPIAGVMMSGGRKAVQAGITVKLPQGVTWDGIAAMTPDPIRQRRAPVRSISSAAYQDGAWLSAETYPTPITRSVMPGIIFAEGKVVPPLVRRHRSKQFHLWSVSTSRTSSY